MDHLQGKFKVADYGITCFLKLIQAQPIIKIIVLSKLLTESFTSLRIQNLFERMIN